MSDEQIIKLCEALSKVGISNIKITGGEPLIRKNIIDFIEKIKLIEGIDKVTMTTNGALLDKYIDDLKRIDINGINISIDTIDKNLFKHITGVDKLNDIINSINKAKDIGIENIKLNCVLLKGINDNQYIDIVKFAHDYDICVKFIEMMPIGIGGTFESLTIDQLKDILRNEFGQIIEIDKPLGKGPAKYYTFERLNCKVGFISPISHSFCSSCNRIRITSDGYLKTCLHFKKGKNLIPYIDDKDLHKEIYKSILEKQEKHKFNEDNKGDDIEIRNMSQIGG